MASLPSRWRSRTEGEADTSVEEHGKKSKRENKDEEGEKKEEGRREEESDEDFAFISEEEIQSSRKLSSSPGGSSSSSEASLQYGSEAICTSSALLLVESLREKPLVDSEIWVKAGCRHLIPVNLPSGVILQWRFTSEPKNVSFAVLHQPGMEEKTPLGESQGKEDEERDETRDEMRDEERDRRPSSSAFTSPSPSSSLVTNTSTSHTPFSSTSTSNTPFSNTPFSNTPFSTTPTPHRVLVPSTRVASAQGAAVKRRLSTKQPGIYTFLFDNSFARYTAKKVMFSLAIEAKEEAEGDGEQILDN
ncbi:uncharacterized protein LOC119570662 [Penaeus monodon]|uniref:uncharacterized protein LOC119570662 n=1 Tax=Penaeus monodon TaxID=6687 RepID=UPI0018A6F5B2|nr:uncharacterized protein LOC119570662 [Penaeus monodon]